MIDSHLTILTCTRRRISFKKSLNFVKSFNRCILETSSDLEEGFWLTLIISMVRATRVYDGFGKEILR